MFPSSVIRKLAHSEEMLAETHNFVGLSAHVKGPIDIDALSAAYDALLEAHPVLTAHLERGPDGRHQIVTDDLLPAEIEVVERRRSRSPRARRCTSTRASRSCTFRLTIRDGQAHADPLRSSQPRRRSSHVQPHRGIALLLHRHGRHRTYSAGHRRARRPNRWRLCSPNGAYTNRTVRASSGSCLRCSPTTFRHPGESPPTSHLPRPCVFRWCRAG